jgi:hypothetical protein
MRYSTRMSVRHRAYAGSPGWTGCSYADDNFRTVQLTPLGAECSIPFGTDVTSAAPGCAQDMYPIMSDIEAVRDELVAREDRWPVSWPAAAARPLVARYPAVVRGGTVARNRCTTARCRISRRCRSCRRQRECCADAHRHWPPGPVNGRPDIPARPRLASPPAGSLILARVYPRPAPQRRVPGPGDRPETEFPALAPISTVQFERSAADRHRDHRHVGPRQRVRDFRDPPHPAGCPWLRPRPGAR